MNTDELIRELSEAGHHEEAASPAEKVQRGEGGSTGNDAQKAGKGAGKDDPHAAMNDAMRSARGSAPEPSADAPTGHPAGHDEMNAAIRQATGRTATTTTTTTTTEERR